MGRAARANLQRRMRLMADTPQVQTLEITAEQYDLLKAADADLAAARDRQAMILRTIFAGARIREAQVNGVEQRDGKILLAYITPNGKPEGS